MTTIQELRANLEGALETACPETPPPHEWWHLVDGYREALREALALLDRLEAERDFIREDADLGARTAPGTLLRTEP